MRSSTGIKRFAGLFVGMLFAALSTGAHSDSAVTKGSKAAGLDACVAPTAEMRRNHMDFLKHQRVETVRKGIRGSRDSLAECVDCHAEKDDKGGYKEINAEGQFCDSCHSYVAVGLACFQCHRKTPEDKSSSLLPLGDGSGLNGSALGLLQGTDGIPALTAEEFARLHATVLED